MCLFFLIAVKPTYSVLSAFCAQHSDSTILYITLITHHGQVYLPTVTIIITLLHIFDDIAYAVLVCVFD